MDHKKQALSGIKTTAFIILLSAAVYIIIDASAIKMIILWIFLPIISVSLVLFLVFVFQYIKADKR